MRNNYLITNDPEKFIEMIEKDFNEMISGKVREEEAVEYITMMLPLAKPCRKNEDLYFWMYDEPATMPSDCTVAYVYEPTYMVTGIIIYALTKYDSVKDIPEIMEKLELVLNGCMGRNFEGHAYCEAEGFLKAMHIFGESNIKDFLKRYGDCFPKFTEYMNERIDILFESNVAYANLSLWNKIVYLLNEGIGMHEVFVYGELLRGGKYHEEFLSDAEFVGEYKLKHYMLDNEKIKPCVGRSVAGEVYLVNNEDLAFLDQLFAEGSHTERKVVEVKSKGKFMRAQTFIKRECNFEYFY